MKKWKSEKLKKKFKNSEKPKSSVKFEKVGKPNGNKKGLSGALLRFTMPIRIWKVPSRGPGLPGL